MKLLITIIAVVATIATSYSHDIESIPIPPESESPYDFRGEPDWDYAPYKALFATKTVGELNEALIDFFEKWTEDGKRLEGEKVVNAYFTCKQALIRTHYLLGQMIPGDDLMKEFHPVNQPNENQAKQLLEARIERERINQAAGEIRACFIDMGVAKEPYPNGPPKDVHELYRPLFEFLKSFGGE